MIFWDSGRPARNEREARKWFAQATFEELRLPRIAGRTPAVPEDRRPDFRELAGRLYKRKATFSLARKRFSNRLFRWRCGPER